MKYIITAILLIPTITFANYEASVSELGWVTRDGKPVKNTGNMKSINGLGGWLLVTPDNDWAKKWETPSDVIPHFNADGTVNYFNPPI